MATCRDRASRAFVVVALGMAGCLDPATTQPGPPASSAMTDGCGVGAPISHGPRGYWIFHFAGPAGVTEHVQLVHVTAASTQPLDRAVGWPLRLSVLPARDWAGNPTEDLSGAQSVGRCAAGPCDVDGDVEWLLPVAGSPGRLTYSVCRGVARGTFTTLADSVTVAFFGVHVDTLAPPSISIGHQQSAVSDSTPLVLLRVDDAALSDLDFLERVRQRSLVAELAIPTRLVSGTTTMAWRDVRRWASMGFGIAAHSRWHRSVGTDEEFVAEFAGSIADMAAQGLPTVIFAQPGVWKDSTSFDAATKLHNWRGSLVRSLTTVFEAYVYNGSRLLPLPDSTAYGLGHITISNGVPRDTVLRAWARAVEPRHVTVFIVHSRTVRPADGFDWFLDSLARAHAAGRIRMVSSALQLFSP